MRALDKSDVGAECSHGFEHVVGVGDLNQHGTARMGSLPSGYELRQEVLADGVTGREPQRCGVGGREQGLGFSRLFKDSSRFRKQGAPVFVNHQLLANSVKQLNAEDSLELAEGIACR